MLDLPWRTCFRWKLRSPHHVTSDGKHGTVKSIKAVEGSGLRAYLELYEAGGRGSGFFPKSEFAYDPEEDRYLCPAGETLRALDDAEGNRRRGKIVTYRAKGSVCAACSLKPQCTTNKNGRSLRRGPGDEHIDLVRAYMETGPYLKAIRKRKVWIEMLIASGQNVKRLLIFCGRRPKKVAQAATLRPPPRPLPGLLCHKFIEHRRKRGVSPKLFNKLVRFRDDFCRV